MNEIVKVSDDDVELVSTEKQVTAAVAEAEVRFELLQKISVIALKRTFPQDWLDLGGRPYLTAPGAERIRPLFRIAITDMESKRFETRDDTGKPRYMYVVTGTAHFRDDDFAVLGTCSSTDQFFSTRRDAQGQPYTLPADQVNEENIIKSAYSDLVRGAVVRVLGLRNLTWDQLEGLGFDRSKATRVQYRDRSSGARGGVAAPAKAAVTPTPAAVPPEAPANGQNGGPVGATGVTPEVQALQQAISATTGEPYDAPASLSLLQTCTAFKDYVGTRDWTRVRPQAALVAIERLRKAREKQVLQQSQQTPLGQ